MDVVGGVVDGAAEDIEPTTSLTHGLEAGTC